MGIRTVVYKKVEEYQDDAARLSREGFEVVSVTERTPRPGCVRILTLGLFALVFPPKPELIVTYRRD